MNSSIKKRDVGSIHDILCIKGDWLYSLLKSAPHRKRPQGVHSTVIDHQLATINTRYMFGATAEGSSVFEFDGVFADSHQLSPFLSPEENLFHLFEVHTLHAAPQAYSATTHPATSLDSLEIFVGCTVVVLVRLLRVGVVLAPLPNTLESDQCHWSFVRR